MVLIKSPEENPKKFLSRILNSFNENLILFFDYQKQNLN